MEMKVEGDGEIDVLGKNLAYNTNQGETHWTYWNSSGTVVRSYEKVNEVDGVKFDISGVEQPISVLVLFKGVEVKALKPNTDYYVSADIYNRVALESAKIGIRNTRSQNAFTNVVTKKLNAGWDLINTTIHTLDSFDGLNLEDTDLGLSIYQVNLASDTRIAIANLRIYEIPVIDKKTDYTDGFKKTYKAPCTIQPIQPVTTIVGADSVTYYPKIQSYVDKKIAEISSAIVGE